MYNNVFSQNKAILKVLMNVEYICLNTQSNSKKYISRLVNFFEDWSYNGNASHRKILGGKSNNFFGYGIVTIEMFEKKMFQNMCHMMGCNDSSG